MYNTLIRNIIRFVILLIIQVLVFNKIHFGNYVHFYVYVLFVMLLPFETPHWRLILDGFLIGFAVDLFNGTPGLNAAATVFMAFIRPSIINITTRKSDVEGKNAPTITEMGLQWFAVYGWLLLLIHNFVVLLLEAFSIKLIGFVLLETLLSASVSLLAIILIIYVFKPVKK